MNCTYPEERERRSQMFLRRINLLIPGFSPGLSRSSHDHTAHRHHRDQVALVPKNTKSCRKHTRGDRGNDATPRVDKKKKTASFPCEMDVGEKYYSCCRCVACAFWSLLWLRPFPSPPMAAVCSLAFFVLFVLFFVFWPISKTSWQNQSSDPVVCPQS